MKLKTIVSAALALALMNGGCAIAQDRRDDGDRGRPEYSQRSERQDRGGEQRRGERDARGNEQGRGAGPDHAFRKGGRLPPAYRQRQYVVDDWRGHHLSAPPRGYHWVQTGGDYVLVAIATGVILQLLLAH